VALDWRSVIIDSVGPNDDGLVLRGRDNVLPRWMEVSVMDCRLVPYELERTGVPSLDDPVEGAREALLPIQISGRNYIFGENLTDVIAPLWPLVDLISSGSLT